jgi:hypothetical protein
LAHLLPAYERDDLAGCMHVDVAAVRATIKALETRPDVVASPGVPLIRRAPLVETRHQARLRSWVPARRRGLARTRFVPSTASGGRVSDRSRSATPLAAGDRRSSNG